MIATIEMICFINSPNFPKIKAAIPYFPAASSTLRLLLLPCNFLRCCEIFFRKGRYRMIFLVKFTQVNFIELGCHLAINTA